MNEYLGNGRSIQIDNLCGVTELRTTYPLWVRRNHVCGDPFNEGPKGLVGDWPPKVEMSFCGPHSCWVGCGYTICPFKVYQKSNYCLLQIVECFDLQHSLLGRSHFTEREFPVM